MLGFHSSAGRSVSPETFDCTSKWWTCVEMKLFCAMCGCSERKIVLAAESKLDLGYLGLSHGNVSPFLLTSLVRLCFTFLSVPHLFMSKKVVVLSNHGGIVFTASIIIAAYIFIAKTFLFFFVGTLCLKMFEQLLSLVDLEQHIHNAVNFKKALSWLLSQQILKDFARLNSEQYRCPFLSRQTTSC